jgi:hypothetical protein
MGHPDVEHYDLRQELARCIEGLPPVVGGHYRMPLGAQQKRQCVGPVAIVVGNQDPLWRLVGRRVATHGRTLRRSPLRFNTRRGPAQMGLWTSFHQHLVKPVDPKVLLAELEAMP